MNVEALQLQKVTKMDSYWSILSFFLWRSSVYLGQQLLCIYSWTFVCRILMAAHNQLLHMLTPLCIRNDDWSHAIYNQQPLKFQPDKLIEPDTMHHGHVEERRSHGLFWNCRSSVIHLTTTESATEFNLVHATVCSDPVQDTKRLQQLKEK